MRRLQCRPRTPQLSRRDGGNFHGFPLVELGQDVGHAFPLFGTLEPDVFVGLVDADGSASVGDGKGEGQTVARVAGGQIALAYAEFLMKKSCNYGS